MAAGQIRVMATQTGYYNLVRHREGDVFDIAAEPVNEKNGRPLAFSERWMELAPSTARPHTTTAQESVKKANDAIKRDNQLSRANENVTEHVERPAAADVLFGDARK